MLKKKKNSFNNEEEYKDLGFGTKVSNQGKRLINRDGSFNVDKKGLSFKESLSFYHSLLTMSWLRFNTIVVLAYIGINLFFAVLYLIIGTQHLEGIRGVAPLDRFLDSFFFSVQTFTTVGYGRINPAGFWAELIASFESLSGLMGFALATGLLYGRFSRPNAKLIYSKNALIAPYRDTTAFEFRLANTRKNQLIDVEIKVMLSRKEIINGSKERKFYELSLERTKVSFFSLSWTVVHPIDQDSPLFEITKEKLTESDAEFLILLKGFDDTFSQSVHSRMSYKFDEVMFGYKFKSIFIEGDIDITTIDLSKINDIEPAKII